MPLAALNMFTVFILQPEYMIEKISKPPFRLFNSREDGL